MIRAVLYILLPLSVIVALVLLSQGVVQSLAGNAAAHTLEGANQTIPLGPEASQIAIKQLGSNGGGFFNANGAHPFENPTFITNIVETFAILLIPMAFVFMFGYMIKNSKQARALFLAMTLLFAAGIASIVYPSTGRTGRRGTRRVGAVNMEGKETRFGVLVGGLEPVHDGNFKRLGERDA
jgi:K+-transporting ATPase ATPase A chain